MKFRWKKTIFKKLERKNLKQSSQSLDYVVSRENFEGFMVFGAQFRNFSYPHGKVFKVLKM